MPDTLASTDAAASAHRVDADSPWLGLQPFTEVGPDREQTPTKQLEVLRPMSSSNSASGSSTSPGRAISRCPESQSRNQVNHLARLLSPGASGRPFTPLLRRVIRWIDLSLHLVVVSKGKATIPDGLLILPAALVRLAQPAGRAFRRFISAFCQVGLHYASLRLEERGSSTTGSVVQAQVSDKSTPLRQLQQPC